MAGVSVGVAYVDIAPRLAQGFAKNLEQQLGGPGGDAAKKIQSQFGGAFKNIAGIAAGTFAAVKITGFFKDSIAAARESNKVAAQTQAVIKSTGGVANVTAAEIDNLSNAIARKTGIDDEQIATAANLLLTFTGIRNEVGKNNDVFNQATKVAVDMAAALGGDASSNAIQLGKALNDPAQGLLALTRSGVEFTAQQKDQIKTLAGTGHLLQAQKIILGELNREFGGSAEAQATAAGKMAVALDNLKEKIGNDLIPIIDTLASTLSGAITGFDAIPGPIKTAIGLFGGLATAVFLIVKAEALWKAASLALAESSWVLATALNPVGIAIASLTAAFLVLKPAALGTEEAVGLFNDALRKTGNAAKDAALEVIATKIGDLQPALDAAGVSARDFAAAVIAAGSGTAEGAKQYADFRNHLVDLLVAGKLTQDQFGKLEDAGGDLAYEYDQARRKAAALTAAQKALGIGADETSVAITGLGASLKTSLGSMLSPLKTFQEAVTETLGLDKVKEELNKGQEWEADYRKLSAAAKAGLEPATKAAAATVLSIADVKRNLTKNIADVKEWEKDIRTLSTRDGGRFKELAAELATLGPDAAAALDQATRLGTGALGALQGQFAERARLMADPTIQAFTDMLAAAAPPIAVGTTAALHAAFLGNKPVLSPEEAAQYLGILGLMPPTQGTPPAGSGLRAPTATGLLPQPVGAPAGGSAPAGASVTINVHPAANASSRQIAADLGDHVAWRIGPSVKSL